MIKKIDVTIPIIPGDTEQSEERPTAIAHASMPTRATKATMRALVLTLPSLILAQMPPQKLAQQPGSDISAICLPKFEAHYPLTYTRAQAHAAPHCTAARKCARVKPFALCILQQQQHKALCCGCGVESLN